MAIKKVKLAEAKEEEKIQKKELVKAIFLKENVVTENSDQARELFNQSRYGFLLENGKVQLSLIEAAYLIDKGVIEVLSESNKKIEFEQFVKKARKL